MLQLKQLHNLLKNTNYPKASLDETCSRIIVGDTVGAIKNCPEHIEVGVPVMRQQMNAIHE
jgi:hypothetical protein